MAMKFKSNVPEESMEQCPSAPVEDWEMSEIWDEMSIATEREQSVQTERTMWKMVSQRLTPESPVNLRKLLGLFIDYDDEAFAMTPQQQQAAMISLARATVFGILNHCYKEKLFLLCEGCRIAAPAQMSQDCLTWDEGFFEIQLKRILDDVSCKEIIDVMVVLGYALKCLILNSEIMDMVLLSLSNCKNGEMPTKYLHHMLRNACDPAFLLHVETIISKDHIQRFSIDG